MRTYITLTLLLILLMAGFGFWYLRSPLSTQDILAPLPAAEPAARSAVNRAIVSEASAVAAQKSTPVPQVSPSMEPVVLDLSLPEDIPESEHVRLNVPERELLLPRFFGREKQSKPSNIKGRLMLEESDEGKTVLDGVEINISRPLR